MLEECKEEGAAQKMHKELTEIPIPHPPILLTGKKLEMSGGKLSLGRKGRGGEEVFRFYLISLYLTMFNCQ